MGSGNGWPMVVFARRRSLPAPLCGLRMPSARSHARARRRGDTRVGRGGGDGNGLGMRKFPLGTRTDSKSVNPRADPGRKFSSVSDASPLMLRAPSMVLAKNCMALSSMGRSVATVVLASQGLYKTPWGNQHRSDATIAHAMPRRASRVPLPAPPTCNTLPIPTTTNTQNKDPISIAHQKGTPGFEPGTC